MAMDKNQKLRAIPAAHTTSATGFRKPFDILSAVAQMTSNSPAVINISQFVLRLANAFSHVFAFNSAMSAAHSHGAHKIVNHHCRQKHG